MTKKEKVLYWFLIIITFGLILVYWKTKKVQVKEELSQKKKTKINVDKLILLLGGLENIKSIDSTHTKVKISFNHREKIQIEDVKKIDGISGVFATSTYIQIIVGNEAAALEKTLKSF